MTRRDAVTTNTSLYVSTCQPCGKRTFLTRKAAQKKAKQIPGRGLHAYRCPTNEGWHLGHLPRSVVRGILPKAVFERRTQAEPVMNGRVARGEHVAEATRILPVKRSEKPSERARDTEQVRAGQPCPACGAVV